jgi:hypothetical protein
METSKPDQPLPQADITDLDSGDNSQMDEEGPPLPYWADTQGDIV